MSVGGFAQAYAARGWPMLVCRPRGKAPLTPHGVDDATLDLEQVAHWLRRWPDANLAIACGAPGPQVLDVDDPTKVPPAVAAAVRSAPWVATARGGHAYFAGSDAGTVDVGFGELRGAGSYVLVPPSMHPSGREYVWLQVPRGPLAPAPRLLERNGRRVGCGEHEPPPRPIVAGDGRWPYLRDFAVRLVRAGVTDRRRILGHLRCEFEFACEPLPPPRPGALEQLAAWAARTAIADRERSRANASAFFAERHPEAS